MVCPEPLTGIGYDTVDLLDVLLAVLADGLDGPDGRLDLPSFDPSSFYNHAQATR